MNISKQWVEAQGRVMLLVCWLVDIIFAMGICWFWSSSRCNGFLYWSERSSTASIQQQRARLGRQLENTVSRPSPSTDPRNPLGRSNEEQARAATNDDGEAKVFFELNGQPRTIRVPDRKAAAVSTKMPKAEVGNPNHIGAPMPGVVATVAAQAGKEVKAGRQIRRR